jgi:hypothetical protein
VQPNRIEGREQIRQIAPQHTLCLKVPQNRNHPLTNMFGRPGAWSTSINDGRAIRRRARRLSSADSRNDPPSGGTNSVRPLAAKTATGACDAFYRLAGQIAKRGVSEAAN